jgi:hypothetical protein
MKTTHEKLITSLLALGLVGVSPVGAQSSDPAHNIPVNNQGLIITSTINEDLNNDGNLDDSFIPDDDTDGDGVLETLYDETNIIESAAVAGGGSKNPDGTLTGEDFDFNNDGVIQGGTYAFDLDDDGRVDLGNETDIDNDGVIDLDNNEDTRSFNGNLDLGEDTDRDGNLDIDESAIAGTDLDNVLDSNHPGSNRNGEVDFDEDGRFDLVDERDIIESAAVAGGGGKNPDGTLTGQDFDFNNDGVIQGGTYAFDLDDDGFEDLGNEVDTDGDGSFDATEDLDGDGNFDNVAEIDQDGDGRFDLVDETNIIESAAVAGGGGKNPDGTLTGQDFDFNNDGVIQGGTYAFDLDDDGFTDLGNEADLDSDGRFDAGNEDLDGDTFFDSIDEDVDGDNSQDLYAEDANNNGTLDTVSRTYMQAVDPLSGTAQDLDIIVANDLLVNGEAVATENYADAADAVLQADIDQNEADSDAADAALQADIDQNEIDSDDADAALGVRIDDEEAARILADFTVRDEFAVADDILQNQIDTNARGIANNREDIDRNARGIAMVAALQHTTVLPGMTQALDLSAAVFEGETGLAINYSRRINDNVQINFGAATTSDGDENVVKAGIGWQW